jgi:SAM-dependent methyltransferase
MMPAPISKTQYDKVASDYASIEGLPGEVVATKLIRNTVANNLRNLKVLDLACGTGTYARMLLDMGVAKHVVGVDVSSEMVRVGQAMEANRPDGSQRITFHIADCTAPLDHLGLVPDSFDLVMGNWLFNYAANRAELAGMWHNVATYLKPGGKFIGVQGNMHVEDPLRWDSKYGIKYGIKCTAAWELENGLKLHLEASSEPKVEFDVYALQPRLYEDVPVELGMREVTYREPLLQDLPAGAGENMEFWKDFLEIPYCILGTALKLE